MIARRFLGFSMPALSPPAASAAAPAADLVGALGGDFLGGVGGWLSAPATLHAGQGRAAVALALDWLEALGSQQQWPPKVALALNLCADEALANIAHHAHHPDGRAAQIWLACGPVAGGIALCIEDDGPAFDPTAQASPQLAASLDEADPGGHGLRLMRHFLRALHYQRHPSAHPDGAAPGAAHELAAARNRLWMEVALP